MKQQFFSYIFFILKFNFYLNWINNDTINISFKILVKTSIGDKDMNLDMIIKYIFMFEMF